MYAPIKNYSWMFYPPPYEFLAPQAGNAEIAKPFGWGMGRGVAGCISCSGGLGCAECGGTCGLGQAGLFGTGLFQSADPSTWGVGEWATIAVGGFLAVSAVTTAQKTGRAVSRGYRKAKASVGL